MKCLEKDRTRRYDTANALAMDIQRHLNDEAVIARPSTAGYKLHKAWRRNKLAFGAAATVLCVLIVGAVVSTWQAVRATRAEHEQSRLRHDADRLRATEAGLRREAEEARAKEAILRQQAEVREKLVKAQVLCDQRKFDEAEEMMNRISDSALRMAGRDAAIVVSELADSHARHVRWKEAVPHARKGTRIRAAAHALLFASGIAGSPGRRGELSSLLPGIARSMPGDRQRRRARKSVPDAPLVGSRPGTHGSHG
jgi:hypothetical protein